jgi:hypothetical protein
MPDRMVVKPDARLTGLHWHLNRLTTIIKHRNCFCIDVKFSTTSQDIYSSMDIRSSWLGCAQKDESLALGERFCRPSSVQYFYPTTSIES